MKTLFDSNEVELMVDSIAYEVNKICTEDVIVTTVMNGGMIFAGNLIPKLQFECQLDYLHVSRYGCEQYGSNLRWLAEPSLDPKGKHVVILDDILDEGITLEHIKRYYTARGAKEITTVVLLWKRCKSKIDPDIFGASIDDKFVFGYGMDLRGYKRNLNEIQYLTGLETI